MILQTTKVITGQGEKAGASSERKFWDNCAPKEYPAQLEKEQPEAVTYLQAF